MWGLGFQGFSGFSVWHKSRSSSPLSSREYTAPLPRDHAGAGPENLAHNAIFLEEV